jgi:pyruvate kinase
MHKTKIICTLGPASFNKPILKLLIKEKVDIFRINLSHTNIDQIKERIEYLKKNKIKNICIDTEGAQMRTTHTKKKYFIKKNTIVEIHSKNHFSNNKKIYLYPYIDLSNLKIGTKIDIGFNSLSIKVIKKNLSNGCLLCKVIKDGHLESKKGVHIHSKINLPCLTEKDKFALNLARKLKIKYYAISFVNSHTDLEEVKKITGSSSFIISKIETKNAIINLDKITKNSNALLIDRGDLSRYVQIEKIPMAQENIIKKSKKFNTPTYVATNLLENMIKENQPTRAESHDIYSTLKEGAKGLVLAAETAIGKNPEEYERFLKRCIKVFEKNKKKIIRNEKDYKDYLFQSTP